MSIEDFDHDGVGQDNGNYFGLPFSAEESRLVLLSVPWDVTASYKDGTRFAPDAIIGASTQLDLYDPLYPDGWREGIGTIGVEYGILERSTLLREDAAKVMKHYERGGKQTDDYVTRRVERVNVSSCDLNEYVYTASKEWIGKGRIVGVVGGDHSVPLGLIRAAAEAEGEISVLHIDAHADLRVAYEGFDHSHASIMYNVVTGVEGVEKIVSVGVRDVCEAEVEFARSSPKIETFYDSGLAENKFKGVAWDKQCDRIVASLGQKVYISFDIDALSPDNCPNTGTPVPGGLSFNEAVYLMTKVVESGRRVVGFDLCEVCPMHDNEWDANVGARILYKLCNVALKSSKLTK